MGCLDGYLDHVMDVRRPHGVTRSVWKWGHGSNIVDISDRENPYALSGF